MSRAAARAGGRHASGRGRPDWEQDPRDSGAPRSPLPRRPRRAGWPPLRAAVPAPSARSGQVAEEIRRAAGRQRRPRRGPGRGSGRQGRPGRPRAARAVGARDRVRRGGTGRRADRLGDQGRTGSPSVRRCAAGAGAAAAGTAGRAAAPPPEPRQRVQAVRRLVAALDLEEGPRPARRRRPRPVLLLVGALAFAYEPTAVRPNLTRRYPGPPP